MRGPFINYVKREREGVAKMLWDVPWGNEGVEKF
jgi:hypothetical protein